jgi:hypothetical protein
MSFNDPFESFHTVHTNGDELIFCEGNKKLSEHGNQFLLSLHRRVGHLIRYQRGRSYLALDLGYKLNNQVFGLLLQQTLDG